MLKKLAVCRAAALAVGGTLAAAPFAALSQDTQRIEITGSSIKRIDAETALPVTTVTRDEIARSGVANVEQLVRSITAVSTAGAASGSSLAGLSTYGQSSVSLRGLGDARTLVLVNGRRLAVFAGSNVIGGSVAAVDINAIPVAAIERIEVLRDGASSLYGSDAVAGVINFILRNDYHGFEATAYYGAPSRGGGGSISKGSLVFGAGSLDKDRFNVMIAADVEKGKALFGRERDFARSGVRLPFFFSGATPSGRIEGIWDSTKDFAGNLRNATTNPFGISTSGYGNPAADGPNGTGHTGPNDCAAIRMFQAPTQGGVGGVFDNCLYDPAADVGLFPKTDHVDLVGALKFQLNPNTLLYADLMWAKTKVNEIYQPSPLRAAFFTTDPLFSDPTANPNNVQPALLIKPSNPNYQSIVVPYLTSKGLTAMIGQDIAVTNRTFLLGPRQEIDTNTQSRLVVGAKGAFSDWDYDVAYSHNESKSEGKLTDGYFSLLKTAEIINNSNWNPWGIPGSDPALDQALQAAKYVGPTISGTSKVDGVDGTISGTLSKLPAGLLQAAFGFNARRESFNVGVPAILGGGDIAGLGGAVLPIDEKRTTKSLFGEFNIPILKGLEANASGRWDHYNDVGSTSNGKLSVRWQPTPQILLRSAYGTGFRAPSLVELGQPQSIASTEQFIDPAFPADGPIQPDALTGGNVNLKPEKSKQFSIGAVLSPLPNVTVGLDWFRIKIDNMILRPGALSMVRAARVGQNLFYPGDVIFSDDDPVAGEVLEVDQTLRNVGAATVEGLDVDARWNGSFPFGKLSVGLNGTYMAKYKLDNAGNIENSVGTIANPDGTPQFVALNGGVVLRWKHSLTGTWTTGPWAVTLVQNYASGYGDVPDLNGDPHRVPAFTTYDAQVAYTGIKNLKLTLGARNLFDKDPPLFIGAGSYFGSGFDPTQYDARGRFIYVSANYKFY
jgi:iron complex outermembrane receptor protein